MGMAEDWLQQLGFDIGRPAHTARFKPDVLACKYEGERMCEEIFVEVETCTSLHLPHTIDQLVEIEEEALKRGKKPRHKASGILVVPVDCELNARFYVLTEGFETIDVKAFRVP